MQTYRAWAALVVAAAWMLSAAGASAQLPLEPAKEFGEGVWPVYEGWYENPDGSFTLLAGYYNRNTNQVLDVPVGPNNFVEPGGPDRGQPTHFDLRRGWGVFTMRVPKEFKGQQLTWTITANNQTSSVPLHLDPQWYIEPFEDAANKNRPPTLRFSSGGKPFKGPPSEVATSLAAETGRPLELELWVTDEKPTRNVSAETRLRRARQPALVLIWHKLRGPGDVTFSEARHEFDTSDQEVTTTATFSEPGEYIVRVEAQDQTGPGGGGSQCCWTSAHVRVTVSGSGARSTAEER